MAEGKKRSFETCGAGRAGAHPYRRSPEQAVISAHCEEKKRTLSRAHPPVRCIIEPKTKPSPEAI